MAASRRIQTIARLNFLVRITFGIVIGGWIHQIAWNQVSNYQIILEEDEFFTTTNSTAMESTTEAHHIVFAIGGGSDYWKQRRIYSEVWWVPNKTRGFVWLDKAPPKNFSWPKTSPPFRVSESTDQFKYTCEGGLRSAIRMLRTLKETVELNLDNFRWYVYGDDDTIFFVENLVTVLRKYDHNEMYYIGQISETHEQNSFHSHNMAFGGGGFAISHGLAKQVSKTLDGCIDRYAWAYGGDMKLQGCITELGVPLTLEQGFHQLDVRGHIYGILAAHPVAPFVSLHHFDNFRPLLPGLTTLQSVSKLAKVHKLDPGRTLQQCFCYDRVRNLTISVSWGYTVQIYVGILRPSLLEKKLMTFSTYGNIGPFAFDIRKIPNAPCDRPIPYFIISSDENNQLVSTTYKRYSYVENECKDEDFVFAFRYENITVIADKLDENYWHKAPRRQCCEVSRITDLLEDRLVIKIRSCRQFETMIGFITEL